MRRTGFSFFLLRILLQVQTRVNKVVLLNSWQIGTLISKLFTVVYETFRFQSLQNRRLYLPFLLSRIWHNDGDKTIYGRLMITFWLLFIHGMNLTYTWRRIFIWWSFGVNYRDGMVLGVSWSKVIGISKKLHSYAIKTTTVFQEEILPSSIVGGHHEAPLPLPSLNE